MYGHGTDLMNMTRCVEGCNKPATIRSDEDGKLRCGACARELTMAIHASIEKVRQGLQQKDRAKRLKRLIALTVVASILGALLGWFAADKVDASPEPAEPAPSSAEERPAPDKWRNLVCNAKAEGATQRETIDWLVDQYSSTPKSARVYTRIVYPTC